LPKVIPGFETHPARYLDAPCWTLARRPVSDEASNALHSEQMRASPDRVVANELCCESEYRKTQPHHRSISPMHDAARLLELARERWPGFEKWAVNGDIIVVLAEASASLDYTGWMECIEPAHDGSTLPLHQHPHQSQFLRVIVGRLRVICNEREFTLRSGQSLLIPPGTTHKAWNPGPGITISHIAFTPGGNEAAYRRHGKRIDDLTPQSLHELKNLAANDQLALTLEEMGLLVRDDESPASSHP
jgi:mannose-6-phosphate isomerase-like protein (cupin superfamily)